MKQKIWGGIAVLVIAATVAWNMSVALKTGSRLSDAALANIEALAQTEDNPIELEEVVIYCDSYADDCLTGSPYNNGHCWDPEFRPFFGMACVWCGITTHVCCWCL